MTPRFWYEPQYPRDGTRIPTSYHVFDRREIGGSRTGGIAITTDRQWAEKIVDALNKESAS